MRVYKNVRAWLVPAIMCLCLFAGSPIAAGSAEPGNAETGALYLVGVGPGDPDLATVRALSMIEDADFIVCYESLKETFSEHLTSKDVVVTPRGVRIWFGRGKKAADFKDDELEHFRKSEQLRTQVLTKTRQALSQGKTVAVLATGDPLIYCPWAWMLNEFKEYESHVVPGLSSFNVAGAALKRQLTAGKNTKSVILTMSDLPDRPKTDTIEYLAAHQATMVIFMPFVRGLTLENLVTKLETHYPSRTPIAIVTHAGFKDKEQVYKGTLDTICSTVNGEHLPFASLVYVGDFLNNANAEE